MKSVTGIIVSALLLLLFACSTVEKTSNVAFVSQQNFVDRTRVDSVMLRDSIFIREKSDTVFYTKYRTLYKERLRVDTIVRCDTLYRDREVVVETARNAGHGGAMLWKVAVAALALLLLWRTGGWRTLLNLILKVIELCRRVFRLRE
jgi:hypothetical protein